MASSNPLPWYLYPVSMSFGAHEPNGGSEKGIDLRVPYHTPVTPLFPGTVRSVATGPYGQEVDVTGILSGQQMTASYVHIDQALVAPGQQVGLGTTLGLSGGQNTGGYHPASPAYSSYPHIEFSLWPAGSTPYHASPIDPTSVVDAVQGSGGAVLYQTPTSTANALAGAGGLVAALQSMFGGATNQSANQSGGGESILVNPVDLQNAIAGGVAGGVSAGVASGVQSGIAGGLTSGLRGAGSQLLGALHVGSLPDLLWRVGLLAVALVLVVVVGNALASSATRGATNVVLNSPPVKTAGELAGTVKGLAK